MRKDKKYYELLTELDLLFVKYRCLLQKYWYLEEWSEELIPLTTMLMYKKEMEGVSLQIKEIYNQIQKIQEELEIYE